MCIQKVHFTAVRFDSGACINANTCACINNRAQDSASAANYYVHKLVFLTPSIPSLLKITNGEFLWCVVSFYCANRVQDRCFYGNLIHLVFRGATSPNFVLTVCLTTCNKPWIEQKASAATKACSHKSLQNTVHIATNILLVSTWPCDVPLLCVGYRCTFTK